MPKKKKNKPIMSEGEFIGKKVAHERAAMRRSRDLADPQFKLTMNERILPREPTPRSGSFVVDKVREFFSTPGGVEFDLSGTSLPEYEEEFLKAVQDARDRYRKANP